VIKHCKLCGEAEYGPTHILERELTHLMTERGNAEIRGEFDRAAYFRDSEYKTREYLFSRTQFSTVGFHEFEAEDNLDMVERLAKERNLI
jgi:hypothetical protein